MALSKQVKRRIRCNKTRRLMPPWKRARNRVFGKKFFPTTIVEPEQIGYSIVIRNRLVGDIRNMMERLCLESGGEVFATASRLEVQSS
jgi:hypothetical protein